MADDVAVPIVFTEYLIAVPHTKVDLPKFFNDLGIKDIQTPGRLPDLGHAGVLIVEGRTGVSKYFEYGRYDAANKGLVRKQSIPDVKLSRSGEVELASLRATLKSVASKAGQGGKISGAYIRVPGKFATMLSYAEKRLTDNANPGRTEYSLTGNSCLHFMKGTLESAGVAMPSLVDPRPVSYIDEIRDDYPDLDYNPRDDKLRIEGVTK